MTAPAADPLAALRDMYQQADHAILTALAKAVQDTIAAPDPTSAALLIEHRLTRELRSIVARLNTQVPGMVDRILALEAADGEAQAVAET